MIETSWIEDRPAPWLFLAVGLAVPVILLPLAILLVGLPLIPGLGSPSASGTLLLYGVIGVAEAGLAIAARVLPVRKIGLSMVGMIIETGLGSVAVPWDRFDPRVLPFFGSTFVLYYKTIRGLPGSGSAVLTRDQIRAVMRYPYGPKWQVTTEALRGIEA
jgi:hypothetical protein